MTEREIKIIEEMALMVAERSDLTMNGMPEVAALRKRLGIKLTGEERDTLWLKRRSEHAWRIGAGLEDVPKPAPVAAPNPTRQSHHRTMMRMPHHR